MANAEEFLPASCRYRLSLLLMAVRSYLLSELRHAHQIHSHFTRQRDQLWLPLATTTTNTRAVLGSMVHAPIIPSPLRPLI